MIEKMGGEIQVNSKKGSGTEAIVYLDFERIKGEYKERTMAELDIQVLDNKRVLLGEDNAMNAKVALCMLEAKGMHVDHAENGQIVVEMFEKSAPGYYDILLMDVRMPVMDGQKATEIIRGMDRPDAKTVPIIAMTANAYIQDVEECRRVGMNAHIAKPIDMKVMYETLIENINN
jgi:CheY-like chemotaxis protein